MNAADYAAGCVALALIVLPWPFAGYRLSRRLLPDWRGAAGALVGSVIAVSGLLVVAELVGMSGEFGRWQLAVVSVVGAAATWWLAAPTPPTVDSQAPSSSNRGNGVALVLAGLCVLGLSAALLGRDARVLHTGPSDVDSLHYHLSDAADFVQSRSINHIHLSAYSDASAYFPHDDELLDAVAMLGPQPDVATLGLNLGFAWLALLACWVIGSRWQMAAAAVAAGASVLAIPLVAGASAGPGLNDIPSIAALLAAVAIAVTAEARPQRWLPATAVGGLALGLAAGSKLSVLGVAVLAGIAVVICAPARRLVSAGLLTAAACVTGAFWYVRDWVSVGSPVPEIDLTVGGHGLHGVPFPAFASRNFSVAHYLGNWSVIRHWFVPQLKIVATPLWPLVFGLAGLGIILVLVSAGERLRRLLGLVALGGVGVYLVTPTTALGPPGMPILFGANVRYVLPVVVIATVMFATAKPFRRFNLALAVGFTVLTFVLLASSTTSGYIDRTTGWAAATTIAATAGWAWAASRFAPSRMLVTVVAVASVLVAANAGWFVQRDYLRHRYTGNQLAHVGSAIHGASVGVAGYPIEYPFTGPTLSNSVGFIGTSRPDHAFVPPPTCTAMRRALAAGHYQYVVIEPQRGVNTYELTVWTLAIPGSRMIFANQTGVVIAVPSADVPCPQSH